MNADVSGLCSTYACVRPYLRDNSSPLQKKKRPYYMVDSSYTVASNPNTMRNFGPLRNAVYRVSDPAEEQVLRRSSGFSSMSYSPMELSKMRSRCAHQKRPLSQLCNIIDKVVVVRTSDYTKNVSNMVFSPCMIYTPQKLIKRAEYNSQDKRSQPRV